MIKAHNNKLDEIITEVITKITADKDEERKNTTILYLAAISIISVNAPNMILNLSDNELCKVRNHKGNGSEIALAELNRRYPGLKKHDNDSIRIAKTEIQMICKWGPIEYWDVSSVKKDAVYQGGM